MLNYNVIKLNKDDICLLLPHRDHALFLLDAVVEGPHVTGTACWADSHPHLTGHFPGLPIVPGVFLIEAAAQLGGTASPAGGRARFCGPRPADYGGDAPGAGGDGGRPEIP
mgnify:CR=1 FL=1